MTGEPLVVPPDDPRACGVTRITGRVEWICVRPVHSDGVSRGHSQHDGRPVQADRHLFVNRYPGRVPPE